MTHKTAYLWGPMSSFTGPLIAFLLQKNWQVHIAVKSSVDVFSLAPLDLKSTAIAAIEQALGSHEKLKVFQDRIRLIEHNEIPRGTTYDALIFCGLPPNFDEPRTPRAPWTPAELFKTARAFKGVPIFIVSSLWGAIQRDGVVPEEFEFERRKPLSNWENTCQQYELRILKGLPSLENPWYLIRLPLLSGAQDNGFSVNFSGLSTLIKRICSTYQLPTIPESEVIHLNYNPDSCLWFIPIDSAVHLFWRLLEDADRPRICNLVSTQSMLNREWLLYLAQSLGYRSIESTTVDAVDLPRILRQLLKDNVMVKTRNLFEVAGRYHQQPNKIDVNYFTALLTYAQLQNWGQPVQPKQIEFSQSLANEYFKFFVPRQLNSIGNTLRRDLTIGFFVTGHQPCSYVLSNHNGQALVENYETKGGKVKVRLRFSGDTMLRLIQNQLSLPRAVAAGQVQMEGPPLDVLRVGRALNQFLHDHPYQYN